MKRTISFVFYSLVISSASVYGQSFVVLLDGTTEQILSSASFNEPVRLNNSGEVVWRSGRTIYSSIRGQIAINFPGADRPGLPDINDSGEIVWRTYNSSGLPDGVESSVRVVVYTRPPVVGGPLADTSGDKQITGVSLRGRRPDVPYVALVSK